MLDDNTIADILKPKYIRIYEWDLYEPFFTRNWTFTYHLPVPGLQKQRKQLTKAAKTLGPWMPALTDVSEYTLTADSSRR